jgi:DNA modification methylase
MTTRILIGDVREQLKTLADESVHCVVTSPPYWGLRDYGIAGQLGMEPTFQQHVEIITEIFREVKRVLRKDGTLWLNYGDSYAGGGNNRGNNSPISPKQASNAGATGQVGGIPIGNGLKPKDLCGIPWRVAFALQADGWYLRQDIIWAKPNPMPESVKDRCTKAHEYVFLLTKSPRYYFDQDAIREAHNDPERGANEKTEEYGGRRKLPDEDKIIRWHNPVDNARSYNPAGRNKRSVWEIATSPFPEAHFATFPPELPEICIRAGTSEKGCCGKCGAPWRRMQERGKAVPLTPSDAGRKSTWTIGDASRDPATRTDTPLPRHYRPVIAESWAATCEHSKSMSCLDSDLIVPCTVLDPFGGAGTTGLVADRLQRNAILIELNPEYAAIAKRRIDGDAPLFSGEPSSESRKIAHMATTSRNDGDRWREGGSGGVAPRVKQKSDDEEPQEAML